MKRICIIGDVHLANHRRFGGKSNSFGCNERATQIIASINTAVSYARDDYDGELDVIFAGDFFDSLRPEPHLIDLAVSALMTHEEVNYHFLLGNHEYSAAAPESHAIGVLRSNPSCSVYLDATKVGDVLFIPFTPNFTEEKLRLTLNAVSGIKIVVSHFGIIGGSTPPWLREQAGAFESRLLEELCDTHGIQRWYSGDWHSFHQHSKRICQIGALTPTGFDNPGFDYGRIAIYSGGKSTIATIPGPRFVVVDSLAQHADLVRTNPESAPLYCRMTVGTSELREVTAAVSDNPYIEVLQNVDEQREATAAAMLATKSATTLAEKLDAFVAKMPLPDNVTRELVLAHAKKYLGV